MLYIPLTNRVWGPYHKLLTKFFPLRFMAQGRSAWAINRRGKRGSVTYSTDREEIFIISLLCVWQVRECFLSMRNGFKFVKQVASKRSQFEIVFKSLAPFSTQFGVKESFNGLYLLNKLRRFGDKSRNSAATEKTLNFSGLYRRARPTKLTNHSVRTKRYNN